MPLFRRKAPATIPVDCPCGANLEADESDAGKDAVCHHCGATIRVPDPSPATVPGAAQQRSGGGWLLPILAGLLIGVAGVAALTKLNEPFRATVMGLVPTVTVRFGPPSAPQPDMPASSVATQPVAPAIEPAAIQPVASVAVGPGNSPAPPTGLIEAMPAAVVPKGQGQPSVQSESFSIEIAPPSNPVAYRSMKAVAFDPTGRHLAVGNVLFDANVGRKLRDLGGFSSPSSAKSVAFSPDGRRAVISYPGATFVTDVASGKLVGRIGSGSFATYTPSGEFIVELPQTSEFFDAKTGKRAKKGLAGVPDNSFPQLGPREQPLQLLAISANGQMIAGYWNYDVHLWGWPPDYLRSFKIDGKDDRVGITSIALSSDGAHFALGVNPQYGPLEVEHPGFVNVFDTKVGRKVVTCKGHTFEVNAVAFSPIDDRIVSAGSDNTVRIWDSTTGGELRVLRGHKEKVNTVAFSPDGKRLATGSDDGTVKVWDLDN